MSVVEVTVKSQKGTCRFGHKVGDKIVFNGRTVKGPICYSALTTILPRVYAMRFSAEFPWETRMWSTAFVQIMKAPLSSKFDA